jgi:cytochrome b subunit of formate dehydrogenase
LYYTFMPPETQKTPEQKSLHIAIVRQMLTLATSGFGLVSALAWNSVIQEFVNGYVKKWLPQGSGLISLLIYAIIITVLAVLVTLQLSKLLRKLESKQ